MKTHLSIIVLLLLVSCNNNQSNSELPSYISEHFNEEDLNHFPRNSKYNLIKLSYYIPFVEANHCKGGYIKMMYKLNMDQFEDLEDSLNTHSKIIISPNDSSAIPVLRNNGVLKDQSILKKQKVIPIPVFAEEKKYFNILNEDRLPLDFKLYIIEYKEGIFMDEEKVKDSEYMSLIIKHGKTKGIALSETRQMAIIWTDVW